MWDVAIVGCGTSGSLLAKRLASQGKRVLVLEAGKRAPAWTRVPIGYLGSIGNSSVDWMFHTENEAGLNNRSLSYPRGRVFGGCSTINGMLYLRGQSRDYDEWAALLNDESLAWKNVLPLFKRHERHWGGASEFHGADGEWQVEKQRLKWDILHLFEEACVASGIPRVKDFNQGNNFGVGAFEVNQRNGRRLSAYDAFLDGFDSENLTVEGGQEVARVLFDGSLCVGVQLADHSVRSAREVVLCAGSVGSVQILERSGIGQKHRLEALGIDVVHANEAVGENLQDHLQLRSIFRVSDCSTLNSDVRRPMKLLRMLFEYVQHGRGPLSMAPSQMGAFLSTPDEIGPFPNCEYHVQPLSLPKFGEMLHPFDAFTAAICNLRPKSRGSIHIKSAKVGAHPLIAPNYLSDERDQLTAANGLKLTREIVSQMRCNTTEFLPGHSTDLVQAAGAVGTTIFHPVGTCAFGSVVDTESRVLGVSSLRVCDASIMPTITSGNTASPVLMLAERLATQMQ